MAVIDNMSLQEIFDKVATHLLTQKKRAVVGRDERCAYRGKDGCMCAVGVLIPDDQYSTDMEGRSVFSELVVNALFSKYDSNKDEHRLKINLLSYFQEIHDRAQPSEWLEKIKELGDTHGLSTGGVK